MRVITCLLCLNPSVNQYGESPFNQMCQSSRWPTLFLHWDCAEVVCESLREIAGDDSSPLVQQIKKVT